MPETSTCSSHTTSISVVIELPPSLAIRVQIELVVEARRRAEARPGVGDDGQKLADNDPTAAHADG